MSVYWDGRPSGVPRATLDLIGQMPPGAAWVVDTADQRLGGDNGKYLWDEDVANLAKNGTLPTPAVVSSRFFGHLPGLSPVPLEEWLAAYEEDDASRPEPGPVAWGITIAIFAAIAALIVGVLWWAISGVGGGGSQDCVEEWLDRFPVQTRSMAEEACRQQGELQDYQRELDSR